MKIFNFILFFSIIFFFNCNKQESGIDINSIHFSIESPYGEHYITDYPVSFAAKDDKGNDITASVKFYVNGQEINGNVYTFYQPGQYQINAKWDLGGTLKDANNIIQAQVIDPRSETRVLMEDFTGTWCVNCPRVQYKIEQLLMQESRVVAVAIHDRANQTDPFHFDQVGELTSAYNIYGYPTPLLNRNEVWDEEFSSVQNYLNKSQPLGVKISNQINGNSLDIQVKVRFDMDLKNENLKLVVFALENGLYADQANATDYYGGQDPIPDMEHNHVLRYAFTSVLGDNIPASECVYNNEYEWNFTGSIPSAVENPNNMEIVAFVVAGENPPYVVNVNKAVVNTSVDY